MQADAAASVMTSGLERLATAMATGIRARRAVAQSQSRSAGNRCLDVANESRQLNAYLIAWPCSGSRPANQAFRITYERQFSASYL